MLVMAMCIVRVFLTIREPGRLGRLGRRKDRVCKHAGLDSPVDRHESKIAGMTALLMALHVF